MPRKPAYEVLNLIPDIMKFLRWENLAFNYQQQYIVFSEATSRTVNILYLDNSTAGQELSHHPILKTGHGASGFGIRYVL